MDNNIDMIDNTAFNAGSAGLDPNKKAEPSTAVPVGSSDATVRSEYASVINKSLETDEIDLMAVQEAQKALESGQLDTPEAAKAAAEDILKYGI